MAEMNFDAIREQFPNVWLVEKRLMMSRSDQSHMKITATVNPGRKKGGICECCHAPTYCACLALCPCCDDPEYITEQR